MAASRISNLKPESGVAREYTKRYLLNCILLNVEDSSFDTRFVTVYYTDLSSNALVGPRFGQSHVFKVGDKKIAENQVVVGQMYKYTYKILCNTVLKECVGFGKPDYNPQRDEFSLDVASAKFQLKKGDFYEYHKACRMYEFGVLCKLRVSNVKIFKDMIETDIEHIEVIGSSRYSNLNEQEVCELCGENMLTLMKSYVKYLKGSAKKWGYMKNYVEKAIPESIRNGGSSHAKVGNIIEGRAPQQQALERENSILHGDSPNFGVERNNYPQNKPLPSVQPHEYHMASFQTPDRLASFQSPDQFGNRLVPNSPAVINDPFSVHYQQQNQQNFYQHNPQISQSHPLQQIHNQYSPQPPQTPLNHFNSRNIPFANSPSPIGPSPIGIYRNPGGILPPGNHSRSSGFLSQESNVSSENPNFLEMPGYPRNLGYSSQQIPFIEDGNDFPRPMEISDLITKDISVGSSVVVQGKVVDFNNDSEVFVYKNGFNDMLKVKAISLVISSEFSNESFEFEDIRNMVINDRNSFVVWLDRIEDVLEFFEVLEIEELYVRQMELVSKVHGYLSRSFNAVNLNKSCSFKIVKQQVGQNGGEHKTVWSLKGFKMSMLV